MNYDDDIECEEREHPAEYDEHDAPCLCGHGRSQHEDPNGCMRWPCTCDCYQEPDVTDFDQPCYVEGYR